MSAGLLKLDGSFVAGIGKKAGEDEVLERVFVAFVLAFASLF